MNDGKYELLTIKLATTFFKPAGWEILYVRFGYVPYTICYNTQGKVSVSMNSDPINFKLLQHNSLWTIPSVGIGPRTKNIPYRVLILKNNTSDSKHNQLFSWFKKSGESSARISNMEFHSMIIKSMVFNPLHHS